VYTIEENKADGAVRRRRHSQAFKAEAVTACRQPGVSIAAVALRYQLNANLLRRWVAEQEQRGAPASSQAMAVPAPAFVPLRLDAVRDGEATPDIVIEIKRGAAMVTVRWPGTAAAACATWLHGWLR
jgi:transposase-like protein